MLEQDLLSESRCVCPPGFSGKYCQNSLSPCDSGPCLHGGQCVENDGKTIACNCPAGYSGVFCEVGNLAAYIRQVSRMQTSCPLENIDPSAVNLMSFTHSIANCKKNVFNASRRHKVNYDYGFTHIQSCACIWVLKAKYVEYAIYWNKNNIWSNLIYNRFSHADLMQISAYIYHLCFHSICICIKGRLTIQ